MPIRRYFFYALTKKTISQLMGLIAIVFLLVSVNCNGQEIIQNEEAVVFNNKITDEKYLKNSPLSLAIFPAISPIRLQNSFAGLVGFLSDQLEREVYFRTRKNYSEYLKAIDDESFDIAIVNGFDYVEIKKNTPYLPLLARSDYLITQVVTNNDAVKTIQDLVGKKIAFPSEYAGATFAGQYLLAKNNIFPMNYSAIFFKNHTACVQAMRNGQADVCMSGKRGMENIASGRNIEYRVISKADPLPQIVILIHPRLKELAGDVKKILLSLNDSVEGQKILKQTFLVHLIDFDSARYEIFEKIITEMKYLSNENQ